MDLAEGAGLASPDSQDEPQPRYASIKAHILRQIAAGGLRGGDRVASENELVAQFAVSRMTANRALRELMAEGVLTRIAGVGTFVAHGHVHADLMAVRNIADEIRARGHRHSARLELAERTLAPQPVAQALALQVSAPVFHTVIVHLESGQPIQLEDRYVNPAVAPDYLAQDFMRETPNAYLSRIAPISEGEHIIEAILPDSHTQTLLGIAADLPCLRLFRRTLSIGRPVTCAWLTHPGDRYRMTARFGGKAN
ncbi:MAG: histidine utilization repressor [Alphaproteobacteria bacterium]|nr:MAG: histidine utilization repressor [Alphaproteobacteria bacterium]